MSPKLPKLTINPLDLSRIHRYNLCMATRYRISRVRQPEQVSTKQCKSCGELKPIDKFYLVHDKRLRYVKPHNTCKQCQVERSRKWALNNLERHKQAVRNARFKQNFGISLDDYNLMIEAQDGRCAICGNPENTIDKRTGNTRNLSVDHDHSTGLVRGLICRTCNVGIGFFKDNPSLLRACADYIERHKKPQ